MKAERSRSETPLGERLGVLGESLVEAGWLLLLLTLPLLRNVYASNAFDPVKIALLRGTVLLMLLGAGLALVARPGAARGAQLRGALATPLVLPALALLASTALACLFSLVPQDSLWGSYARENGLLTELCLVSVFALTLGFLRRESQWRRFVQAALLSGLVVVIFALLQRAGLDPTWGGRVMQRAISTLGNATALASYLLLIIFLTIGWLLTSLRGASPRSRGRLLALGVPTLVLQGIALLLTGSRGPLLGLLLGLAFIALALLARRPRRGLLFAVTWVPLALAAAGLAGLTVFGAPESPRQRLVGPKQLARSSDLSVDLRMTIWEQGSHMVWPRASSPARQDYPDPRAELRPWVGYGPDALGTAFAPFRTPEVDLAVPDRVVDHMHSDLLDRWATRGVPGLLCGLFFVGSILVYLLRWLGLLETGRDRWQLAAAVLLACGLLLPLWRLGGAGTLVALGPAAPLLGGLFAFLSVRREHASPRSWTTDELWVLVLGGGLVGRLFETQLGVTYPTGSLLSWVLLAALALRGCRRVQADEVPTAPGGIVAYHATALGIVFAVLTFDLLVDTGRAASLFEALRVGLLEPSPRSDAIPGLAFLAIGLLVVGLAVGLMSFELEGSDGEAGALRRLLPRFFAALLAFLVCFLLFRAQRMVGGEGSDLGVAFGLRLASHAIASQLLLVVLCFGLACVLQQQRMALDWRRKPGGMLAPLLLLGIALLGNALLARPLAAGVLVEFADAQRLSDRPEVAVASLDEALERWPDSDEIYAFRGTALLEYTRSLPGSEREPTFRRALDDLERARELRPLEPRHALNLGRSYRLWALHGSNPGKRYVRLREALGHSEAACTLAPGVVGPLVESARTHALLGDLDRAVAELRRALSLAPRSARVLELLAPALAASAQAQRIAGEAERERELREQTVDTLQQLLEVRQGKASKILVLHELADQQSELGRLDEAIATTRALLRLAKRDPQVHEKLAGLYEKAGNPASSRHRERAADLRKRGSDESFDPDRDVESIFGAWFEESES